MCEAAETRQSNSMTKYNASQRGLNSKISFSLSIFNEIIPRFNVKELHRELAVSNCVPT